ncbi:TonB-dependent Receptor Plug Domain [Ekhidna lutea]|uniref:TonB-dependent Receptor Plug Domain n=1 Tax=Ekhidna lutea TaxID=447679 RepID=A0A239FXB7_EKHLU|nr:carboxypeptidase-like regulatory domain-containing protein [Ekhidna lutea]SNS60424.1 TonB-dependent Receptor Plug Domain [Ekhidna lutea]
MKLYFFILFFVFGASAIFSQQIIEGKVVDASNGEGLIGAHVYLLKNWRKGGITDVDGKFSIEMTENELADSLIVSYIGFEEVLVPVSSALIIELQPIEMEGETVVVTAKPLIAEEFKYMEIKKIDIYTNPAAKADPILAVNSLPSSTTTDESANISLRGSSPLETGVFMNNVPIYDAVRYSQLNGIGTFSIFNTSIIQNVTVFPGNPPLEFGNATSGIIAMETDERVLDGNANSAILSLANVGISREQKLNEKQSLKLFTNWQPSAPIKMLNEEALRDIKSFTSNDFGGYWYGSGESLAWKVLSYSVKEAYQFRFKHPSFQGIFDQRKVRSFLISSIEKPVGGGSLSLNNGLSYSNGDYGFSNVAFNVQKKDLFLGANYLISNKLFSLKTGLSYDYRMSAVDGNFHEYYYALGPNHPTIELIDEAEVKVFESYGYFKYFFSDKIAFGTGVRKNIPTEKGDSYISSQANVAYTDNLWTITIGGGKYHKRGLVENTGEPFSAESSQKTIDIKREDKGTAIALSLFDKAGFINSSAYEARGAELYASHRFSGKLNASASITLLDATSESEAYTYDLSYFIRGNVAYSPGRFWTIESTIVAREGTTFQALSTSVYQSDLDVYEPIYGSENPRLPYYSNVGLSVSKIFTLSEKMNIITFASLSNIFDRKNVRSYTYNFDYSERDSNFYSRRTGYVGAVINF